MEPSLPEFNWPVLTLAVAADWSRDAFMRDVIPHHHHPPPPSPAALLSADGVKFTLLEERSSGPVEVSVVLSLAEAYVLNVCR